MYKKLHAHNTLSASSPSAWHRPIAFPLHSSLTSLVSCALAEEHKRASKVSFGLILIRTSKESTSYLVL